MQKGLSLAIKKIKSWIKSNKVLDVVIFGSYVRGKISPNDIDLCIIIKVGDEAKSMELSDSLAELVEKCGLDAHISLITSDSFIKGESLVKTLLSEGYSITNDSSISSVMGFEGKSLFTYSLKKFSSSERVKFHYALRGRHGSKGVLKEINGRFLGSGAILIPSEKEDILKDVFERWKADYKINHVLFG